VIPAQSHDYLPQSHTCFNTICLPPYESEDEVESRLLAAINSGAGFGVR
jgi:E3 ubiquitin-protein ligase HECTD2